MRALAPHRARAGTERQNAVIASVRLCTAAPSTRLKSMTIWPASAAFQENELGSLAAGKRADFVVLDRDIMRVAAAEIPHAVVLSTWLGGTPVYEKK
jgi:predicted amidohydrolase YtcJ